MKKNTDISNNRNLYLAAGISAVVILTSIYILAVKYIIPVYNKEITFIHDFSFYKSAAERFLDNPSEIYKTTDVREEITFIYPPPAVLIFLPFAGLELFSGYLLFLISSFIFLLAAIFLFIESAEELLKLSFSTKDKIFIYLLSMGNAPAYMNFQSSQVGPLLIFLIALFIYLLIKNQNTFAGVILSFSIFLKLYPIFLIFTGIQKEKKHFIITLVSALLIIPLVSLLFIPGFVYREFFFDILPGLSSYTETNTYNQSLIAVVMRFAGYADGSWALMEIPAYLKIINHLLFGLLLLFCWYKIIISSSKEVRMFYTLIVLSSIPVFSTFGWGHLYILSIPLLLLIIVLYKESLWILPFFLIFAIDFPDSVLVKIGVSGNWFYQLFHARFLIANLFILSFAVTYLNRRNHLLSPEL